MGGDREKFLRGDSKARGLEDDALVGASRDEHEVASPGKRTLVEQQLAGRGLLARRYPPGKRTLVEQQLAEVASSQFAVGHQAQLDRYFQPLAPESRASIVDPALAPPALAWPGLDDFRSRGLHEVLAALSVMRGRRGLMDATRSAAARATRPARPSLTVRPAPPDPAGQAMWRAVERRAATLYRRAVESGEISAADPAIEAALARAGGGRPLPADVRREMELALATSLERVRIHTDAVAADAARAVRAAAFTVGEDIFFADGAYAPETPAGQRLLAHELTHVVQAYQGRVETGGAGIKVSSPGEALEREADEVAARIGDPSSASKIASRPALAIPAPAPALSPAAGRPRVMRKPAIPGRTFAEPSSPIGKLGRVQAPKGVFLRVQPAPDAASPIAPIPFNGLVYVDRRTTQARASERWCYVIATEVGAAGFCEERYLAIDPPEPTAQLRRTRQKERLAVIAEEAYGLAKDANNSRLYVQALYLANRGRASMKLEHVDLGFWARAVRGGDEEETLKIYKGATVLEGHSIWIPSKAFIEQLQAAGAVTGGSTYVMDAWHKTKDFAGDVVDGVKYAAGFIVGILEGAANAVIDLFKGAADMVEAVLKVIWHLVTGNPGRIRDMLMGWVAKLRLAWAHRGQIVDEFLKKWSADSMWDRGLFQGEVLGWVMMTVLLILVTMGEAAPAAIGGITLRWPQLTKLLQTVDTLGDVTTYLGAAAKTVRVPREAIAFINGKLGKSPRINAHEPAERVGKKVEDASAHLPARVDRELVKAKKPSRFVSIAGYAQHPRTHPWPKNPDGSVRSVEDAIKIARAHGVLIPDDILIQKLKAKHLPDNTYARYFSRRGMDPNKMVTWEEFYDKDLDELVVSVSEDVFRSDEAIVAILAHEMYELNNLRRIFEESGGMINMQRLYHLINPGIPKNLHDQAWDAADKLVLEMRKGSLP